MPFGKEQVDDTEEKTKDAKKNVKIDMLKSKGYSERDAILKGSKEDAPEQETPSEEMSDDDINEMGESEDGPSIELEESQLGSSPEIGSTIELKASAQVVGAHLKDDGSKCFELKLSNISVDAAQVSEEAPVEDVPENEV